MSLRPVTVIPQSDRRVARSSRYRTTVRSRFELRLPLAVRFAIFVAAIFGLFRQSLAHDYAELTISRCAAT